MNKSLITFYQNKRIAEHIKDKLTEIEFPIGKIRIFNSKLLCEKEVFFFDCPYRGKTIGPTPLHLGVLDILRTRFGLYTYCLLTDHFLIYQCTLFYGRIMIQ